MYVTTFIVKVLSQEPTLDGADFDDIMREADTGEYVAHIFELGTREVTPREMAMHLLDAGSDPGFFHMDAQGNPLPT